MNPKSLHSAHFLTNSSLFNIISFQPNPICLAGNLKLQPHHFFPSCQVPQKQAVYPIIHLFSLELSIAETFFLKSYL